MGFAGKKRADERTRTADLVSLRVIHRALQGCAGVAIPPYLNGFLFSWLLRVAPYCTPGGIRLVSKRWRLSKVCGPQPQVGRSIEQGRDFSLNSRPFVLDASGR
jgi:hypothetical protein